MSQSSFYEYYKTSIKDDMQILICEDSKESEELESVAKFFKKEVIVFPDFRPTFGDDLRVYKEELHQLFSNLREYYKAKTKPLVISPLKTLLFHMPSEDLLKSTTLEFGSNIKLKEFKEQMLFWGYSFVDMVQVEGEISFRGDIIDIYVPSCTNPIRISLFDETIEQIKLFELESQRTVGEELDSFEVTSAFFSLSEDSFNTLNKKIEKSEFDSLSQDIASLGLWHLDELSSSFLDDKVTRLSRNLDHVLIDAYGINDPQISRECFELELLPDSDNFKDLVVADIASLLKVHKDKKITIIASNKAVMKQMGVFDLNNITEVYAPYILNILSGDELVISLNRPDKKRRRRKSSIL